MNIAETFRALGNENRLAILMALAGKELCVADLRNDVNEHLSIPLSQSAFSQHLTVLRDKGLVDTTRQGVKIIYTIRPGVFNAEKDLIEVLAGVDALPNKQ